MFFLLVSCMLRVQCVIIDAPLSECCWGNIFEIFLKKILKKIFLNLFKIISTVLLRFVLKISQKYVIFKVSNSFYKSFYYLKVMVTSHFTLPLKVQVLMKYFHILDIYKIRWLWLFLAPININVPLNNCLVVGFLFIWTLLVH